jgi:hypothetical protein
MKNALKFLSGSFATYVLMAACSATSSVSTPRPSGIAGALAMGTGGAVTVGGAPAANEPDGSDMGRAGADVTRSGSGGSMMITDPVPDASAEPAMDGGRLKAVYLVGSDGSRQWDYAWWDSARGEQCSFIAFSDGTTRCVPAGSASAIGFSDASCSVPLFATPVASCTAPKYALLLGPLSCGTYSYSSVQTLTPVTPDKVYAGTSASCVDETAAYKASYTFYTGTEIPLSSFVSAATQHG